MPISEQLRDYLCGECDKCGVNEVARRAGISSPQVSRIRRGERGFSVETLDQIGDFLGLVLVRANDLAATPASEAVNREERRRLASLADELHHRLQALLEVTEDLRRRSRTEDKSGPGEMPYVIPAKDYDADQRHTREGL